MKNQFEFPNFLAQLDNPRFKHEKFFEVMRDFRKGGLNPAKYDDFIKTIQSLPPIIKRPPNYYHEFDKYKLHSITEDEMGVILREVQRRGIEASKKCWHPEASPQTCKVDNNGNIIVSAAHSLQNNGVLSKISENGMVTGYVLDSPSFDGKSIQKNHASIFWGFCNTHDAIFTPIETSPYIGSDEQNFLFAYRGFVVSSHKKEEVSIWINYDEQAQVDIDENKKVFDKAILTKDYSIIETEVFELPRFYPIAVSTSFYLDYDFEGNEIKHSDKRMEDIYVTLHPTDSKTYFIISYFKEDKELYKNLGDQLRKRDNLRSDITMLLAAHTENIYFNPVYYDTFIDKQKELIEEVFFQAQFDYGTINAENKIDVDFSFTPSNYLANPNGINFFGY